MPGAPPPVVLAAQHEGENFSRVSVFEWDNRPSLATLLGVMTQTRRPVLVGISLALLLALGAGVAFVIGDELGIRSEPADVPTETLVAAPESASAAPPEFTQISAPDSARLDLAVGELQDAVAE